MQMFHGTILAAARGSRVTAEEYTGLLHKGIYVLNISTHMNAVRG